MIISVQPGSYNFQLASELRPGAIVGEQRHVHTFRVLPARARLRARRRRSR